MNGSQTCLNAGALSFPYLLKTRLNVSDGQVFRRKHSQDKTGSPRGFRKSVEATARQAYEQGFHVTLALDAMTDVRKEAPEHSIWNIFPRLGETGSYAGDYVSAEEKERYSMNCLSLVSYFFGGVFTANAIPHFVSGTMERAFQSPFAKPPGKGISSSTVNVLWGFFNAFIGYLLVAHVGDFQLRSWSHISAFSLGALLISMFSARHFGQFHGGNTSAQE